MIHVGQLILHVLDLYESRIFFRIPRKQNSDTILPESDLTCGSGWFYLFIYTYILLLRIVL